MPISNPEAIRYVNEVIRPVCEEIRALEARISSHITTWDNGVNALIPVDGGEVQDSRDDVSTLQGNDVVGVMVQLNAIRDLLNQVGVPGVIAKPCVRALEAH